MRDERSLEALEHICAERSPPGKVDGNAVRGLSVTELEKTYLIDACVQTCALAIDGDFITRR
jgi:hypothetical protein